MQGESGVTLYRASTVALSHTNYQNIARVWIALSLGAYCDLIKWNHLRIAHHRRLFWKGVPTASKIILKQGLYSQIQQNERIGTWKEWAFTPNMWEFSTGTEEANVYVIENNYVSRRILMKIISFQLDLGLVYDRSWLVNKIHYYYYYFVTMIQQCH